MKENSMLPDYKICIDNAKYASMVSESDKNIIIGIPKDFDLTSDESSLIIDNQVLCIDIPDYFIRLHQLPYEKQKLVEKIIKYFTNKGKAKERMGINLDALVSFIEQLHGTTISQSLVQYYSNVHKKYFCNDDYPYHFNSFKNMLSTAKFQDKKLVFAGNYCAYYFVNPSYIEKGYGIYYRIIGYLSKEEEIDLSSKFNEYLLERYNTACNKLNKQNDKYSKSDSKVKIDIDELYNIEHFLDDIVGLKGEYERWKIHNMTKYVYFDKLYSDLIEEILNDK